MISKSQQKRIAALTSACEMSEHCVQCQDLRAEVERLRAALRHILDFSDSGMRDGDGARDVARRALGLSDPTTAP